MVKDPSKDLPGKTAEAISRQMQGDGSVSMLQQEVLPLLFKIEQNTRGISRGIEKVAAATMRETAVSRKSQGKTAGAAQDKTKGTATAARSEVRKQVSQATREVTREVTRQVTREVTKSVSREMAASRQRPTATGTKSAQALAERKTERAGADQRRSMLDSLQGLFGKANALRDFSGKGDAKDAAGQASVGPIWGAIQEMGDFAGDAKDVLAKIGKRTADAQIAGGGNGLRDALGRFAGLSGAIDKGNNTQEAVLAEQRKLVSQGQAGQRAEDKRTQQVVNAVAQGGKGANGSGGMLDLLGDVGGGGKAGKGGKVGRLGRFGRGAGSLLGSIFGLGDAGGAIGEMAGSAVGSIGSKAGGLLGGVGKVAAKGLPLVGGLLAGGVEYAQSGSAAKAVGSGVGSTVGAIAGGALGSVLGPAGTVGGAVLGGVAGDWLGAKSGGLVDALLGLTDTIETSDKKKVKDANKPSSGGFLDFLSNTWTGTKNAVGGAVDAVKGGAGKALEATKSAGGTAVDAVKGCDLPGPFRTS